MSLDDIHAVEDFSEITVRAMIERLRRSRTPEQCIYRETELDEMWRMVDLALKTADPGPRVEDLRELRGAIQRAHDLAGMEWKPGEGAQALEAALPLVLRLG